MIFLSTFILIQLAKSQADATFTRGPLGQTCRPEGLQSGGYCAVGNLAAFSTPEECLSLCEAWDECVCGVAWSKTPGHFFCHLFTGSNTAPDAATCQAKLKSEAYPGSYKPYGALTCGSTFQFGVQTGLPLTRSTLRDNFEYTEGCSPSSCTGCRVRRSWTQMDASARKLYIDTVTGIRLGTHGSALQTRYVDLVRLHRTQFGTQIHSGPTFFPWHRWFILQMENLLREVEHCITVPYWAWEMDAANAKLWTDDYAMWGPDNYKIGSVTTTGPVVPGTCVPDSPFGPGWTKTDNTCARRRQGGSIDDLSDIQTYITSDNDMWSFYQHIDGAHGSVHCAVGGDMCASSSAEMPEFYMHHANIDRIWAKWQVRGSNFRDAWSQTWFDRSTFSTRHDGLTFDEVMPGVSDGATARMFKNIASQSASNVCVQYDDIVGGLTRRNLAGNAHHEYNVVSEMVDNLPQDPQFWVSVSHVTDVSTDKQSEWVFNMLQEFELDPESVMEMIEEATSHRASYISNRTYDESYDPKATTAGCAAFTRISGATCTSVQDVLKSNPEWAEFISPFTDSVDQLEQFVTPGANLFSAGICEPEDDHHFVISKDCSAHTSATCDKLCKSQTGCVAFTIDANGCCTTYSTKPSTSTIIDDECCECFVMDTPSRPTTSPSVSMTTEASRPTTSPSVSMTTEASRPTTSPSVSMTTEASHPTTSPSVSMTTEASRPTTSPSVSMTTEAATPTSPSVSMAPSIAPTRNPRTDVCFGWGDPHVSSFHPISRVNGLWNVYDRFYGTVGWESYFKLEQDGGDVLEVRAEHEDLNRNGLTFIVYFKVLINKREVLAFRQIGATTNPPQQMADAILDPQQVTIGATGSVWPSGSGLAMPHAYSFPNWPEVKIFFNFWSTRRIDLGIMFTGPAGVPGRNARATGLCCTKDSCPNRSSNSARRMLANPSTFPASPAAPVCPKQESCCANFAQHDILYKSCLVDALDSCCVVGADEATCCTVNVAKCGVDYECESGQTCMAAGFCVEENPEMCKGEWSEFSSCSTTCGEGVQSRQYRVISLAKNDGADCPAQNGEIETRLCTRGQCGDVCEGVVCASGPVCMQSFGICEDVSSRFSGLRMHECAYDPLPKGASCSFGTCDGEGICIAMSEANTGESNSDELFNTHSLLVGAGAAFVVASLIAILWCCLCKHSDKTLDEIWNLKDAASISMQADLEDKPSKHL